MKPPPVPPPFLPPSSPQPPIVIIQHQQSSPWFSWLIVAVISVGLGILLAGVAIISGSPSRRAQRAQQPISNAPLTFDQRLAVIQTQSPYADPKLMRYVAERPSLSEQVSHGILHGKVVIGMTREQAELAWGPPEQKTVTSSALGTHEQWIYDGPQFLFFEGDRLTTWQISKSGRREE